MYNRNPESNPQSVIGKCFGFFNFRKYTTEFTKYDAVFNNPI